MRYKSKFIRFFALLIVGILVVNISLDLFVLRNTTNSKNERVISPKSSGTVTITSSTPYGVNNRYSFGQSIDNRFHTTNTNYMKN